MKRVLVTGGTGFLGCRLAVALREDFLVRQVSSRTMDLSDPEAVNAGVGSFAPDFIIHCAALAETDYCDRHPERCREINVKGTVRVARACSRAGARLIFLSTEQVFNGNSRPGPYKEEDLPEPDTEYGRSKLEAETMVASICPDAVVLRLTWMFGLPGRFLPSGSNILWNTITGLLRGEGMAVPVNEYRGMTNADELADRFRDILTLPAGLYHGGSENPLGRYETVCHILDLLGLGDRRGELVKPDRDKYDKYPRDIRLDTSRLAGEGIRFDPTPDAIARCLKDYGFIGG